jgi:hypothetical protein
VRRSLRAAPAARPVLLAAWALAAAPAPVVAATVTWGTPTAISGDTDVRTSGLLIGALNLHGPTTTVNGVTFEAMFGVASGDFALSSPGIIHGVDDEFGSALLPYAGLSDAYKGLLDSGKFKDPDASAGGVRTLAVAGGPAGKGKLQVQAGNNAAKGQNALPTGVAASLQGASSATLQVLTSDARCFEAGLSTVQKADGVQFKAKAP